MQASYLNPVMKATNNVFQSMLQLETSHGELEKRTGMVTDSEANILIGITGDIEGSIIYSFPEKMALKMVSEMSGMEIEEIDKFVTSAIGELANIISGQAASDLEQKNYECDIAPPQAVIGKQTKIITNEEEVLVVPMNTDYGEFELSFSLSGD